MLAHLGTAEVYKNKISVPCVRVMLQLHLSLYRMVAVVVALLTEFFNCVYSKV